MEILLLFIRSALAGIFILAGVAKFLDLKGSQKAFQEFGIPRPIAMPSSIALSVAEIAIGVAFLSVETAWFAAIGAAGLLLLFVGQMIYQTAKGNAPDCHCFGQIHSAPVGKVSIFRNVVFALLALVLVARGQTGQGTSLADPGLDVMQLIFGLAFLGLLIAIIFYLKKISEQQTELMRRAELMELVARDGGEVERETTHPHEGPPIGAVFPDFYLADTAGGRVSLKKLRSDGLPTLFFFVTPTCNPCKAMVPEFEEWRQELDGKVRLVFLSSGKAEDNVEKFGAEISKMLLLQKSRELADLVKAPWTPTAVFVDRDGRIASHLAAGDTAIRELVERVSNSDLGEEYTHFAKSNGHVHANKIGQAAPQFSLKAVSGDEITSDYFKSKQTLVTFWSQTCPHCVNMADDLIKWDKARGKDDPGLLLFTDGDREFLEGIDLSSPVIRDEGHKTSAGFGMSGTPSAVLVDEKGKIISETAIGAADIWSLIGKRK